MHRKVMKHHLSLSRRRQSDEGKKNQRIRRMKLFFWNNNTETRNHHHKKEEKKNINVQSQNIKWECRSIMDVDWCSVKENGNFWMSSIVIEFSLPRTIDHLKLFFRQVFFTLKFLLLKKKRFKTYKLWIFLLFHYFLMMKNISIASRWDEIYISTMNNLRENECWAPF